MSGFNRTDRIASEIHRALSEIVSAGLKDPRVSRLTSIVRVEVTRDLKHAKIYASVYGTPEEGKNTIEGLKNAAGFMRRELGSRIDIRSLPELHFELDTSIEHGIKMTKILNDLKDTRE